MTPEPEDLNRRSEGSGDTDFLTLLFEDESGVINTYPPDECYFLTVVSPNDSYCGFFSPEEDASSIPVVAWEDPE